MNQELSNLATAVGTYNSIPTSITSQAVVVNLVSGLTITKTADKQSWADGVLTYTITVENQASENYVKPVITDILDDTLVDFVGGSVMINGTKAEDAQYQYDTASHTLTIQLDDITPTQSSVATFQVTKKS